MTNYGPTPEEWDQLRERLKGTPNPYGHIEVVQDDGTTRRPEPGEILTSEGLQRPPVPGAILGSGGWVVQDGWKGTTHEG